MNTEHDLRDAINELANEALDTESFALSLEQRIARNPRTTARSERPRLRPARALAGGLAAAVVVVAVVVAAGVVRSKTKPEATPTAAASALSGVTWTDPTSGGTVVFTATTARVSDGCDAPLYALKLGPHTLQVGQPIGNRSVCLVAGGPKLVGPLRVAYDRRAAAVKKFDRVLSGRSTWNRNGATLTITAAGAGTIVLKPTTPAVPFATVTGERWVLHKAADRTRSTDATSLTAATLTIARDGTVTTTDLCNAMTGTATVTATTIDFALGSTQVACNVNPTATTIIDAVLSGQVTYAIGTTELVLSRDGNFLTYRRIS